MTAPFLETLPRAGRRLLLVTYAFPPDATVGALRWEMMLRFAAQSGWTADVILMDPADSQDSDESRLAHLPTGLRLYGIPLPDSRLDAIIQWRNLLRRPRRRTPAPSDLADVDTSNTADATAESGTRLQRMTHDLRAWKHYAKWQHWARDAAALGISLARNTDYACVVSSGPPHMAHDAARQIATAISRPLILDFRDPWTSDDVEPDDTRGRTWRTLSNRFERACIGAADLIMLNTESAERFMRSKYPAHAQRMITVMNGADSIPRPPAISAKPFVISYAGSLYGGRRPHALFRAVGQVVKRENLTTDDIRLEFMGIERSQRAPLQELARRENIEAYFTCETRRPRAEAQRLLDRSAMVVVLPQIHIHSVPAKVYEYVQRPVWVLVLSEPDTAVSEVLRDTSADIVMPDDVDGIAKIITQRLRELRSGGYPPILNADGRFSRERQAQLFLGALDRIVSNQPRLGAALTS
jgi:glycosyltransferase involved in cell wall biosynthesis